MRKDLKILSPLLVLFFMLLISIPNIVGDYFPIKKKVLFLFPQGWCFFTRNPREDELMLYKVESGKVIPLTQSGFSSYNFWGFSRKSRRVGFELAHILTLVESPNWQEYKGCKITNKQFSSPIVIKKDSTFLMLKQGKYIVEKKKKIAWEWAVHKQERYASMQFFNLIIR